MRYLKKIPLTACGTSLAVASLGNLLGIYSIYFKIICGTIAIVMLIVITLKIILYRQDFKNDLNDINIISVFPTYFMTIMVLSTYKNIFIGEMNLSKILWLSAFAFHIFLALMFVKNHIIKFDIKNVLPNWCITCVAYALIGIAAPEYGVRTLGQIFLIIGLISYFILFPIILYRILIIKQIPENLMPTIWLLNSPINICIVSYLSCFSTINPMFLIVLLSFSLFSFVFTLCKVGLKQIIKKGFNASLSVFTFPTVIFVTAIRNSYSFFYNNGWIKVDCSNAIMFLKAICVIIVFGILISHVLYIYRMEHQR